MADKPTDRRADGREPIIGIDLGTTNSLVAFCDESGPRTLGDEQGEDILPSVVRIGEADGGLEAIGWEARRHAVEHPENTIYSVKRLMGRGMQDLAEDVGHLAYAIAQGEHNTARVVVGDRLFSPQEISALILRRLREVAEHALGRPVGKAVITVPAYFDDAQRQATRDAGRIAGLEVVRIVNEPTAAALAYNLGMSADEPGAQPSAGAAGLQIGLGECDSSGPKSDGAAESKPKSQTVAVFDLGGGTFDISILRLRRTEQGIVDQVLATSGDTHLGGDDVDRMIVELIQDEIREQFGQDISFPPATRQGFRNLAEATKVRLSDEAEARIEIELPASPAGGAGEPAVYERTITKDELEAMIEPWIDRTIDCCRAALKAAKLTAGDIDRVVMVGGSTRMPRVRERVGAFFGTQPYTALDPDKVVALGAAVQASILMGINREMLLLDVIPLSLGIETMGGAVAKLIMANTTIPARATEIFTTYGEGQTSVKIHIVQGERELVGDCRSLGQFELTGVPPMPAGLPKVEVTFLVDANGLLNVEAVEKRSEVRAGIQIIPNHGLTREEVSRMESESYAHAAADMTAHRLIDLRNQARLDIRQIRRQLEKVGEDVPADYRADIEAKIAAVEVMTSAPSPDPDAFHRALDAMDKTTIRLAEMAVAKALQGAE